MNSERRLLNRNEMGSCEEEPPKGFFCARDFHHNGPCTHIAERWSDDESQVVTVVAELKAGRIVQRIVAPFDLAPGTYSAFLHVKRHDESPEVQAQRTKFEQLAKDSNGFKRSRKGTYVNPAVARDWKWFQLGSLYEQNK